MSRLILVRHGESAHVHGGGLLATADVHAWRSAYDLAGITDRSTPPDSLVRVAANATHVVASDLPRAVASAERLARGRGVRTSPLLREIPLSIPNLPVRLPLTAWGMAIHLGWTYRIMRGQHTPADDRARVSAAREWLRELAEDGVTVVVTHGVFRSALARELIATGWIAAGKKGGYSHWSEWSFTFPNGAR